MQQCRKVPEQEKVRECNLVNNLVFNCLHGDEVPSMQCNDVNERCWDEPRQPCKQVPKEMVGMHLLKYSRIFPRKRLGCTSSSIPEYSQGKGWDAPPQVYQNIPKNVCQNIPKNVCQNIPKNVCQNIPKNVCQNVPKKNIGTRMTWCAKRRVTWGSQRVYCIYLCIRMQLWQRSCMQLMQPCTLWILQWYSRTDF